LVIAIPFIEKEEIQVEVEVFPTVILKFFDLIVMLKTIIKRINRID
jgi:hypothetical protein